MEVRKSRPEDWTEKDEEFKRVIDKLAGKDPDVFTREIRGTVDYSFLDRPRVRRRHLRILTVAASLLIVIFLSGAIGIWLNHESAVAAKFELERILHNIEGKLSADNDSTYTVDEGIAELTVRSFDHLDRAEKFLPELILPDTEPTGYTFEKIDIQKSVDHYWVVSIQYISNEGDSLSVRYFNFDQESSVGVSNDGSAEQLEINGVSAFYWSEITGTSVINFIHNNVLFMISSTKMNDKENLSDIAELFIK